MKIPSIFKFFIFLLPFLEIAGFIVVGGWIGVFPTLLLIILTTLLGLFILRTQGFVTLINMQRRMQQGEHPQIDVLNGALTMFAGLLLLIPGFITDSIGILLLIPIIRVAVLHWLVKTKIIVPGPSQNQQNVPHGRTIEGEWREEKPKKK